METKEVAKHESALQPKEEIKTLEISGTFDITKMVKSVGKVDLTAEQKQILFDNPLDPKDVEITPDGLIYLPWIFPHERLRKAFEWDFALLPKGDPKFIAEEKLMIWGFYMIIKQSLMGFAIGHCKYYSNNPRMTYADAIEGCKSIAVKRLCKDLGMFPELWKPEFIRRWSEEWAVSDLEYDQKRGKKVQVWYKKTEAERKKPPTQKTTEYITMENEIKSIIDDPDFTGMVMHEGKEQDLDYLKAEMTKRIESGVIYQNIEKHRDNLKGMLQVAKNPKEASEIDNELSDDNIVTDGQGLFQEEQLNETHEGNLSEEG